MVHRYSHSGTFAAVALAALVPLALTSCAAPGQSSPTPQGKSGIKSSQPGAPIAAVGHGSLLLADGHFAEPTPELVREGQQYYLARLRDEASPKVRAAYDATFGGSSAGKPGSMTEIDASARKIAWLLERVKPADQASIASINAFLQTALDEEPPPGKLTPEEIAKKRAEGSAYTTQCKEAGVPIPPKWDVPRIGEVRTQEGKWKYRGKLERLLAVTQRDAHVYVYRSEAPRGVCFGLPRTFPDGSVALLGVICQGEQTSKTCFWDNYEKPLRTNVARDIAAGADGFLGGPALYDHDGGTCTGCHRGENNFVVHPGSPLDLTAPITAAEKADANFAKAPNQHAKGWVTPLVDPRWPQNRKPSVALNGVSLDASDGSCLMCHSKASNARLAELEPTYCGLIMTGINEGMMPPAALLQGAERKASAYHKHLTTIAEECTTLRTPELRFEPPQSWHANGEPGTRRLIGDFDSNGRADLAHIDAEGTVLVSLAPGRATNARGFGPATEWLKAPAAKNAAIGIGDFDGDGDDDLALLSGTDLLVAKANVTATRKGFDAPKPWLTGMAAVEYVAAADFDNDRLDDLVTFAADGQVQLLLSKKSRFEAPSRLNLDYAQGKQLPLVGDVNGDSFADVVLVPTAAGRVTLAISSMLERGVFAIKQGPNDLVAADATRVRLGDVDGDGRGDLIAMQADGVFAWRYGDAASFLPAERWSDPVDAEAAEVEDVDGDGRADLIALAADGSVQVALSEQSITKIQLHDLIDRIQPEDEEP